MDMSEIFETAIVEKRNVLNELRATNLTLQELRFFSIYLSKINPYDKKTKYVRFPLSDFQKIMEFGRLNIQQLKDSTDSLLGKKVHIPLENGGFKGIVLFDQCEVNKDSSGRWYVEISASNAALPLMFDFKDRYFKYELWNALRLKSANQIRMYEILKQYEKLGKREISVSDLREMLGIAPNEYPRWNNFKTRVLDSCQQALKDITDISFDYERGKVGNGGKWLTIIFNIRKNEPTDSQMVLFEQDLECHIDLKSLQTSSDNVYEQSDISIEDEKNTEIEFYMGACNNEFTEAQTDSLLSVIAGIELPDHVLGTQFAKYHYLEEKYLYFNAYSEQHTIANRYSYFYAMLVSERDKQNDVH